jgi:hypothetical protein
MMCIYMQNVSILSFYGGLTAPGPLLLYGLCPPEMFTGTKEFWKWLNYLYYLITRSEASSNNVYVCCGRESTRYTCRGVRGSGNYLVRVEGHIPHIPRHPVHM